MTRKLTDADEDAIAAESEARRTLTLKERCKRWGVDKKTLYKAIRRAKRRKLLDAHGYAVEVKKPTPAGMVRGESPQVDVYLLDLCPPSWGHPTR